MERWKLILGAAASILALVLAGLALWPEVDRCRVLGSINLSACHVSTPTSFSTPRPVPTPTPILPGMILLEENFGGRTAKVTTGGSGYPWQIKNDINGNRVYEIDNRNRSGFAAFDFGFWAWGDYSITYRFRVFEGTSKPYLSVGFRMQDFGQYILNFEGTHNLIRLLIADGRNADWALVQEKNFELTTDRWYSVRIQAADDLIQVYVDGQRYLNVNDNRLDRGAISWAVDPGNFVQFDDIRVTAIDSE